MWLVLLFYTDKNDNTHICRKGNVHSPQIPLAKCFLSLEEKPYIKFYSKWFTHKLDMNQNPF